jgi:Uncharacterised protein family (UPF0175)
MNVIVRVPDDVANRLAPPGGDLAREALEALVLEAFRAGRITKAELRKALGFQVLDQVDGFLKAHGVFEPYTAEELEREIQTLARLGY